MTYRSNPTEAEEGKALIQWADLRGVTIYHIPNEGQRSPVTAQNLRLQGLRKGVPDYCIPIARSGKHGLYIELKRRHGSRIRPEQIEWLERLQREGYAARVCYGWEQARDCIENYLTNKGTDEGFF